MHNIHIGHTVWSRTASKDLNVFKQAAFVTTCDMNKRILHYITYLHMAKQPILTRNNPNRCESRDETETSFMWFQI